VRQTENRFGKSRMPTMRDRPHPVRPASVWDPVQVNLSET
jgi:hypothetical protein